MFEDKVGVLSDQWISKAISEGWIRTSAGSIADNSIQPASLDLHLGSVAYPLRYSFLPFESTVEAKLKEFRLEGVEIDISKGAVLERNRPYLIPLQESLRLPAELRAKANPKSSTGRVDVFTRVISDKSARFDEVRFGYSGRLYLEVVSRSFTIRVKEGLTLNQLRLISGHAVRLSDVSLLEQCAKVPLLFHDGKPLQPKKLELGDGLFMSLDLRSGQPEGVGYKARRNSDLIDLSYTDHYLAKDFWEPVHPDSGNRVVLEPEEFYLLLSYESIRIPPDLAAEMSAYDPTAGELRTHYAGFFDPGFGYEPSSELPEGSRAALEVRAHDVPFVIEHGQPVCKLSFERMCEVPSVLYGRDIGSHYQAQNKTLSKHFRVERPDLSGQLRMRMY